jgi:hypothetical protein
VEEITTEEAAEDEQRRVDEDQGAGQRLAPSEDDVQPTEIVMLREAATLVQLLREFDVGQFHLQPHHPHSHPASADDSTAAPPLSRALQQSLCDFAALLSRVEYGDLQRWSSGLCQPFLDAHAFPTLKRISLLQSVAAATAVQNSPMQAAEFILHTCVPLVWSS